MDALAELDGKVGRSKDGEAAVVVEFRIDIDAENVIEVFKMWRTRWCVLGVYQAGIR